ncbi:hypothetical protein IAR55_005644 [Kwoniella newhampshirensis]|uniref:Uncharacterized protein n=1 Tax=Kwoniella newhampshirensis TaxID=1651941 RepID=A0AAW0YG02_9TREE
MSDMLPSLEPRPPRRFPFPPRTRTTPIARDILQHNKRPRRKSAFSNKENDGVAQVVEPDSSDQVVQKAEQPTRDADGPEKKKRRKRNRADKLEAVVEKTNPTDVASASVNEAEQKDEAEVVAKKTTPTMEADVGGTQLKKEIHRSGERSKGRYRRPVAQVDEQMDVTIGKFEGDAKDQKGSWRVNRKVAAKGKKGQGQIVEGSKPGGDTEINKTITTQVDELQETDPMTVTEPTSNCKLASLTFEEFNKRKSDLDMIILDGENAMKLMAKKHLMGRGSFGWVGSSKASLPYGTDKEKIEVAITVNIVVNTPSPEADDELLQPATEEDPAEVKTGGKKKLPVNVRSTEIELKPDDGQPTILAEEVRVPVRPSRKRKAPTNFD